jgi:hypothetical protein
MKEYDNRVLEVRVRKWRENGDDCTKRNFITCTFLEVLLV